MHNNDPDFIGIDGLKDQQARQLASFEKWASEKKWYKIHENHYDWWMFPINQPSSYGFKYVFYDEDIAELKSDAKYIRNYLRGVEILAQAWGWDLYGVKLILNPDDDQTWQDWPIRLYKCAKSLQLFGFIKEFESMRQYALYLLNNGKNFYYSGRDLAYFFQNPGGI